MSLTKKLSPGTAHLLARLKLEVEEALGGEPMPGDLEITQTKVQVAAELEGYRTTTDAGERGVSVDDIQAVSNYRRDKQNAVRIFGGDAGHDYMQANQESDSYRITVATENNELSIQSAFYRPGKEEQGNTNFISITDQWAGDDEDKAIEAHLKGLTRKLAAGKK